MLRLGVDSGGTFTDFVVATREGIEVFKLPSTPHNPSQALLSGVKRIGGPLELNHGTTIATNAILEQKGAKTALVVNEGLRDLLFLARQTRPKLYDLEPELPRLPIRRQDCFCVAGRMDARGEEIEPISTEQLTSELDRYESVAVCLLFSYANASHELAVKEKLKNRFVSLSHEVSPEFREYERACATFINAYVDPILSKYLSELSGRLVDSKIRVMLSAGGLSDVVHAMTKPIATITSGPAAGVVAAERFGTEIGESKIISFDVGGTSTDVALVAGSRTMTGISEIGGIPARLRRVDVHTIGCGGGSIASVDSAGALKVGPESVGSEPGPALYGRGSIPALTDAHVVLGRLPLDLFAADGSITSDANKSEAAMRQLALELGVDARSAAQAIIDLAVAQMATAIRRVTSEQGFDPAEFCLVPFGGAGGLHACDVANELGITRIAVPSVPGVFSACGLLMAPRVAEANETVLGRKLEWEETYSRLERRTRQLLGEEPTSVSRIAEMRYAGQSYELPVPTNSSLGVAARDFEALHQSRYGVVHPNTDVEWVTAIVRAEREAEPVVWRFRDSTRPVMSFHNTVRNGFKLLDRRALAPGTRFRGPAIVLQEDSTTVIASDWEFEMFGSGAMIILKTASQGTLPK